MEGAPKRWVDYVNVNLVSGLFSGAVQAGLLNPWDRALYLSVTHHRNFLHKENFAHPYRGFSQAVVQRTISGGLYFILQAETKRKLDPMLQGSNPFVLLFLVGTISGTLNGMVLNPFAVVKYHAWNQRDGLSFWKAALHMVKHGGFSCFFKGMYVTGLRDCVFGASYESIRTSLRLLVDPQYSISHPEPPSSKKLTTYCFFANMIAAAIATTISSPFNYVRTMKYSTQASVKPAGISAILMELWKNMLMKKSLGDRISYMQGRLVIGWGTARVGVSMSLGQYLFDWSKRELQMLKSSSI